MRKLIRKAPHKPVMKYTVEDMLSVTIPNKRIVAARGLMLVYFGSTAVLSYIVARAYR